VARTARGLRPISFRLLRIRAVICAFAGVLLTP
jgi:hypothetical protein